MHVAAWIEELGRSVSVPTVKQRLASVRHLFDWLVRTQVVHHNPAISVRGPSHSVRRGKTLVLAPDEARALLDSIDVTTPGGMRDRALIGLMVYSFARVGAALAMRVEDVFVQNRRLWVRLTRKAASGMRCRAIIISKRIFMPISRGVRSKVIARGRCFERSHAGWGN